MIPDIVILSLVTLQRLGELWLAGRNTRRLLEEGAVEHSPGHYPWIVAVHGLWLASLWLLAREQPIDAFWLGLFVLIELARLWVLLTLGPRWTTRIIVLPGAPLVEKGPYRMVDHPNYWVVAGEILVLPLVFGLWQVAVIFTILNAAVIGVRVRAENKALNAYRPR